MFKRVERKCLTNGALRRTELYIHYICSCISSNMQGGYSITGPIPTELGRLQSLRHMEIGYNSHSGVPPQGKFCYKVLLGVFLCTRYFTLL
ncbi:uncharacterized protein LOC131069677 isoform X4 [Cryptomeria japonica]|uniref:uncharacterized protein LOC131069677 isoform X4 n=1 Tax=Cryptomeria japonica TaxID=3369 RepID=UPI0027DA395C|nr:uncharacterized protein LOC131069677 isoform X4 [Cryptomeria japonica]